MLKYALAIHSSPHRTTLTGLRPQPSRVRPPRVCVRPSRRPLPIQPKRRAPIVASFGYAAPSPTAQLGPFHFERREPGPRDVEIEILYCGVCHADLHLARDEQGGAVYPVVPGHEIVGRVTRVESEVAHFFCAEHGITADVEVIRMDQIDQA
jgi:alcohol dehydrogenase-like protein